MLLCKMAPVRGRNKLEEPKKEKKDAYANIFVHVPTQRHTRVCVCISSFQMESGIDLG